jgi:hypothetical protein
MRPAYYIPKNWIIIPLKSRLTVPFVLYCKGMFICAKYTITRRWW